MNCASDGERPIPCLGTRLWHYELINEDVNIVSISFGVAVDVSDDAPRLRSMGVNQRSDKIWHVCGVYEPIGIEISRAANLKLNSEFG